MTTATLENPEIRELIVRGLKLSREDREEVMLELLDSLEEQADDPVVVRESWQATLSARWKAIQNGSMPTVSAAEAIEHARERLRKRAKA